MYSTIYIVCPAKWTSGQSEALHQLCHKMRQQNFDARIYYYGKKLVYESANENYKKYDTVCTSEIVDNSSNMLIVPETYTYLLYEYKHIKHAIWWLGVDSYYQELYLKFETVKPSQVAYFDVLNPSRCENFVQSEYARQHLLLFSINPKVIHSLSDYIDSEFIEKTAIPDQIQKEDIVLYNPKNEFEFTEKLKLYDENIQFVKMPNHYSEYVNELVKKSKVYIDFGRNQSKERQIQEVAANHCCIITGMRGSSKYEKDIPIPDKYKFWANEENIPNIIAQIKTCFENYDTCIDDFKYYRNEIINSEKRFEDEIKNFFN